LAFDTKKLKEIAVSEAGLIFDPTTGYIFTTNRTGALVINALKEGADTNKIKGILIEDYEVREEDAEHDVSDFVNQLIGCGLIKDA
jgi:hypothetical protein